jgi:hypothetical protein
LNTRHKNYHRKKKNKGNMETNRNTTKKRKSITDYWDFNLIEQKKREKITIILQESS